MANLSHIKLLVFDVDGVLTDGGIVLDDDGRESKRFHVRDGFAFKAAMRAGLKVAVVTGRASRVVSLRMGELGVDNVQQGVRDKAIGVETACQKAGVQLDEAAYLGDDLIDLPAMLRVGFRATVADGAAELQDVADLVTTARGGHGAAREFVEHILKAQNRWDDIVERYSG